MAVSLDEMLQRTLTALPVTREDLLMRGITGEVTDRIINLRRATDRLEKKYASLGALENRIKRESLSPDDHTLYTDLIEWRAIENETRELFQILGAAK